MADQVPEKKTPEPNGVDPKSFLLPKKEVHTPDSAQRTSAGVLLAQEQKAGQEGLAAQKVPGEILSNSSATPTPPGGISAPPAPKAEPKKEVTEVQPIQTYKSDVESLVERKNVSVVSIAAAEAEKREKSPLPATAPATTSDEHWILKRASLVVGGILMIAVAAGALAYVLTRPTTVDVTPLSTEAPFMTVDSTKEVSINPTATAATVMNALNVARVQVNLSLGLVERLYVTQGSGNSAQAISAQKFLTALAPQAPQALARTLSGQYLLGVHSFDENQAFLIFHSDAYETAYAAMLQWEPTMSSDLTPLFTRTPPVHANPLPSTKSAASTTSATSTTPSDFFSGSSPLLSPSDATSSGLPTTFADRVVENRDARVLQTTSGDIVLLWTFLDRNTLVIATNEFTLREVITRAAKAPTIPLPR